MPRPLLFSIVAAIAAGAFTPAFCQTGDPVTDYWLCVKSRAAVLEPSGETAEAIATAAADFCRIKLGEVRAAPLAAFDPNYDDKVKAIGREKAITVVVEIRASKAAPKK